MTPSPADGERPPEPWESLSPREKIDRMRARSWVLQILYRWESEGSRRPIEDAMMDTFRTRRVAPGRIPSIRSHVKRIQEHLDEIDRILGGAVDNWRLDRLSRIDRSVLRLAATEMLFDPDVPERVALKEGIRLAGQYGGPSSPRFVNGVLDAVLRQDAGAR